MMLLEYSITCILLIFALFLVWMILAASIRPSSTNNKVTTSEGISIVIPCRNEAHNIPSLFASLLKQRYAGPLELIIVDDGSTDGTAKMVDNEAAKLPFPTICLPHYADISLNLTRKQQALDFAVAQTRYDLVALTDADMHLLPDWAASLASALGKKGDLAFGHTAILPEKRIFSVFQSFQLGFLFAVASLLHVMGIPGSCMGNNLMIRKKTYLEQGGQKALGYSVTEDRALLERYRSRKLTVAMVNPFVPTAITMPHQTIRPFLHQMLRWAKGGLNGSSYLVIIGIALLIEHTMLILPLFGYQNSIHLTLSLFNFGAIWCMTGIMFKKNRVPVTSLLFPLYYALLVIETVMMPILSLTIRNIRWKSTSI